MLVAKMRGDLAFPVVFVSLLFACLTACGPWQTSLLSTDDESLAGAPAWELLAPGLELAQLNGPNAPLSQVTVLRVEPERYDFRLHYRPSQALLAASWREELPQALAIINANFYDAERRALGWLVVDSEQRAPPHARYGGAFIVRAGAVAVSLTLPEDWGDVMQAAQGFPNLLRGGEAIARRDASVLARRTVFAKDQRGRVVFIFVSGLGCTLAELSEWLAGAPLELNNAINMDGGGSTMLILPLAESAALLAREAVPAVLAIHARSS